MSQALTRDELLALPAVVDIRTAGTVLGIGRSKAYELAQAGAFPVRVLRLGAAYRVATAELLELIGIKVPDGGTVPAA